MAEEIEYHLRALAYAVLTTLSQLWWKRETEHGIWSDAALLVALHWLAALCLLWWRVPNGRWALMVDTLKRIVHIREKESGK